MTISRLESNTKKLKKNPQEWPHNEIVCSEEMIEDEGNTNSYIKNQYNRKFKE